MGSRLSLAEQARNAQSRPEQTPEAPPPYVSPELIAFLDKAYPNKCPSLGVPERQLWHDVGCRAVVEHLIKLHREQVEKDISSKV